MPGNGIVAEPGLAAVRPGSGVIMMWPVSVCHHVSTTGQRPPPITCRYQAHAFGLIGSPTEPSRRIVERLCFFCCSAPHFMAAAMAVGGVEKTVAAEPPENPPQVSLPGLAGAPLP